MNYLFIGNEKLVTYLSDTYSIKEKLNLENYNGFVLSIEHSSLKNHYESIANKEGNCSYSFYDNNEIKEYKDISLSPILHDNRFDIIYFLISSKEDIEYTDSLISKIKKHSRASYALIIDNLEENLIKEKLYFHPVFKKIIYLNAAIKQYMKNKPECDFSYFTSLFILSNLYYIDLNKLDDVKTNYCIYNALYNPFDSVLFQKHIAFIGADLFKGKDDYSFIEYLYPFNKYSYLKDCSRNTSMDKIKDIDPKEHFDLFVIEENKEDKENLTEYVKETFHCDVLYLNGNDVNDYVLIESEMKKYFI